MKTRKLPARLRFQIEIRKGTLVSKKDYFYVNFLDEDGQLLPDWKSKLTPNQWLKASKYLNRELRPFLGYSYTVKPEFEKEQIIKIN